METPEIATTGIDPDLLALMTQTIVVQSLISNPGSNGVVTLDGYGRHYAGASPDGTSGGTEQYGTPQTIKCRLEYQIKVMPGIDGRDRFSSGRAYLAGFYPNISTESRVTVPNQTQPALAHPVIMYVENNYDENGLLGYNTTLHFE
jgi:hypothetical protein